MVRTEAAGVNLFGDEVRRDPYPAYEELRRSAPVFCDRRSGVWFVSRYHDARRVLTDPAGFSNKNTSAETTLLGADLEAHTRVRNIVKRAFTAARIKEWDESIRSLADDLVERAVARGTCEVINEIALPLPSTIVARMLGFDATRLPDMRRWSEAILLHGTSGVSGKGVEHPEVTACRAFLAEHMEGARRKPCGGWVTDLIAAQDAPDCLAQAELVDIGFLLIVAGTETTTNLIGNATMLLAADRQCQSRLRDDPQSIAPFVEEVLRFESPVQRRPRFATMPVEIAGTLIPENARVDILIGSANRDREKFADADTFDLDRRPNDHLAFGAGPHFCLGAHLARLETISVLSAMLRRSGDISRATPQERVPYAASFSVRGPQRMLLTLE
jgi:cytochrome P450